MAVGTWVYAAKELEANIGVRVGCMSVEVNMRDGG